MSDGAKLGTTKAEAEMSDDDKESEVRDVLDNERDLVEGDCSYTEGKIFVAAAIISLPNDGMALVLKSGETSGFVRPRARCLLACV